MGEACGALTEAPGEAAEAAEDDDGKPEKSGVSLRSPTDEIRLRQVPTAMRKGDNTQEVQEEEGALGTVVLGGMVVTVIWRCKPMKKGVRQGSGALVESTARIGVCAMGLAAKAGCAHAWGSANQRGSVAQRGVARVAEEMGVL